MRVELGNWLIEKAKGAADDGKTIAVRMIANCLDVDRENQEILPQAFSKATVDNFLEAGIIDWHHLSVTGKSPEQRAQAILGKPYDFQWEMHKGKKLPVVYGRLSKSHPIVRDSILPHLEADVRVFGASVGGNVKKARNAIDPVLNRPKEQILEIEWEHIAIAPASRVISRGSEVSMVKAYSSDKDEMVKDTLIKFRDVDAFEEQYNTVLNGDEVRAALEKALEVGAGTDSAALTGADALRVQSLEGSDKKKKNNYDYSELFKALTLGLQTSSIGPSDEGVKVFLRSKGFSESEATNVLSRFKTDVKKAMAASKQF